MARTNYFKVAEGKKGEFEKWAVSLGLQIMPGAEGRYCITAWDTENGSFPTSKRILEDGEDTGQEEPMDFVLELSKFLAPGSVAVIMTAGHEAARYVTGDAEAIDCTGKRVQMCLDMIYAKAARKFGLHVEITKAEY